MAAEEKEKSTDDKNNGLIISVNAAGLRGDLAEIVYKPIILSILQSPVQIMP